MKKRTVVCLGFLLLVLLRCAINVPSLAETSGDYTYKVTNGMVTITGWKGKDKTLVIPATLGGKPVTSIGDWAFESCSGLTSVSLPEGLTSIGEDAFYSCRGLTSVTLPESLTSIGDCAFFGCSSLTSVTLPESLTSIGEDAFCYCSGLTSVTLPEGLTSIGDGAFESCSGLTSVSLPEGLTSIGDCAFFGCSSLTSVSLPEGLTSIGDDAFSSCSGLTSVTLPEGLTSIGDYAFSYCSGLTSVTLPEGLTSIGDGAFDDCNPTFVVDKGFYGETYVKKNDKKYVYNTVMEVTFGAYTYRYLGLEPDTLTITKWAGRETVLVIPDTLDGKKVTGIAAKAFENCTSLVSVTLPDSVISLDINPFLNCSKLESIYVSGDHPVFAVVDGVLFEKATKTLVVYPAGRKATAYAIPQNIKAIGEGAFNACRVLTSVTLPDSLTHLANNPFSACEQLELIDVSGDHPVFAVVDGVLIEKATQTLVVYPAGRKATAYTIPQNVKAIGRGAFDSCRGLTSVTLPVSLTTIEEDAFIDCSPNLMFTVARDSVAQDYVRAHGLHYTYPDANDWLNA